jgi:hypothetical protein
MACIVGITTRPKERKKEWQDRYPTLRNWELVGPLATRREAEAWEKRQRGCERSGGGDDPDFLGARSWGYRFDY